MLDVSVILPVLAPSNDFLRCLYSIRTAFAGRLEFEIICVVRDVNAFSEYGGPDLKIIREDGPGIYGAMNKGVNEAVGHYLYFIGQDDILLPAAANAVLQGEMNQSNIIIANVFWGMNKIYKNNPLRRTLVWKNWCHQGIFYDRALFMSVIGTYPVDFETQSDHYVNIVFTGFSGLILTYYDGCIAWYAADGFSTRTNDREFRRLFPGIVRENFGLISYLIVVLRRALLAGFKLYRK